MRQFVLPMPNMNIGKMTTRSIKDGNGHDIGMQEFVKLQHLGGYVQVPVSKGLTDSLVFNKWGTASVRMEPAMSGRAVKGFAFVETGFSNFELVGFKPSPQPTVFDPPEFVLEMSDVYIGEFSERSIKDKDGNVKGIMNLVKLEYVGGYVQVAVGNDLPSDIKSGQMGTASIMMEPVMSGRSVQEGKFAFVETGFSNFEFVGFKQK